LARRVTLTVSRVLHDALHEATLPAHRHNFVLMHRRQAAILLFGPLVSAELAVAGLNA
jgi:hypothetical protein